MATTVTTDLKGSVVRVQEGIFFSMTPLENRAYGAGRTRAVAGGALLTVAQLASRLRCSKAKAALVIGEATKGYDKYLEVN